MRNQSIKDALWLSLGYFVFRGFLFISGLEYSFLMLHRFPIGIFMPAFSLLLFFRTRKAFMISGDVLKSFKEGGRSALFTAVFTALLMAVYYQVIDPGYLSGLVQERVDEIGTQLSPEDLQRMKDNLSVLNSYKIRILITLSGISVYGLVFSLIFSLLHAFRYKKA